MILLEIRGNLCRKLPTELKVINVLGFSCSFNTKSVVAPIGESGPDPDAG